MGDHRRRAGERATCSQALMNIRRRPDGGHGGSVLSSPTQGNRLFAYLQAARPCQRHPMAPCHTGSAFRAQPSAGIISRRCVSVRHPPVRLCRSPAAQQVSCSLGKLPARVRRSAHWCWDCAASPSVKHARSCRAAVRSWKSAEPWRPRPRTRWHKQRKSSNSTGWRSSDQPHHRRAHDAPLSLRLMRRSFSVSKPAWRSCKPRPTPQRPDWTRCDASTSFCKSSCGWPSRGEKQRCCLRPRPSASSVGTAPCGSASKKKRRAIASWSRSCSRTKSRAVASGQKEACLSQIRRFPAKSS